MNIGLGAGTDRSRRARDIGTRLERASKSLTCWWHAPGRHSRLFFLDGRLAVNNPHYYSVVLGVKDPIHRQKMAVKAMDVVLFGPPKDGRNHIKDATLFFLLVCALLGYWYAYRTDQHSKRHLAKLMQHMEVLSSAEKELQELQIKLEHARQEQDITLSQKEQLERQLEEETRLGSSANLSQVHLFSTRSRSVVFFATSQALWNSSPFSSLDTLTSDTTDHR